MLRISTIFTLLLISYLGSSQSAIRGVVYEEGSGETIPFADVVIQGTTTGTTTDLDGAYVINVEPGTYNLVFNYLGYSDLIVEGIDVKEGVVEILDVRMGEDSEQLAEVVVTAKAIRNTEAAVLTLQKKSVSFIDGLSSQTFSKTGDGDAAAAIKRVPGVSVEGGKYVYVRGLGDRYTKTILNGMDIPGLDPDRNTVQMDIFPTNLIDNIIVYKTFTPNLPGDFTGGMVEIITKDFPERLTSNLSVGLGYNPQVHFNGNFLTQKGGGTDFLAFDDGTRALPFNKRLRIPDVSDQLNSSRLTQLTSDLNPNLGASKSSQFLDRNLAYAMGNQINGKKMTIGYNLALNYSNNFSFDDDANFREYRKSSNNAEYSLQAQESRDGGLSTTTNAWSALGGLSLKIDKHKIGLTALRSQNAELKNAEFIQNNSAENPAILYFDILQYTQREMTNGSLSGKHTFADGRLVSNWKGAATFSRIYEPDIRSSAFELTEFDKYEIRPSVGATVNRDWRELMEQNYSGKFDLTYEFKGFRGLTSKVSGGGLYTYKKRDYEILNYVILVKNQGSLGYTDNGDHDLILAEESIFTYEGQQGTYLDGNFEPANTFQADQNLLAFYLMNELPLTNSLKLIYGARLESFKTNFTGQNNIGDQQLNNETVLDETSVLPSTALIYTPQENMNIRVSYASTLARPTFKEKSLVQITDRLSSRTFIGNLDLEQTSINNYDVRWEYFFDRGQVVSVSGFYKTFEKPIELTVFDECCTDNFMPRNVGDAEVIGLEIEGRKSLNFISLPNFSLNANVAFVASSVAMTDQEREARISSARDGEVIEDTRDMAGQSPILLNIGINYREVNKGLDANLSFNMQGERLSIVGIANVPDVYEQPFESLNFKVTKRIGKKLKASFSAQNLLNSKREFLYKSFNADDRLFSQFSPGRTFSFSASYAIK